jgi:hypothetical protein
MTFLPNYLISDFCDLSYINIREFHRNNYIHVYPEQIHPSTTFSFSHLSSLHPLFHSMVGFIVISDLIIWLSNLT